MWSLAIISRQFYSGNRLNLPSDLGLFSRLKGGQFLKAIVASPPNKMSARLEEIPDPEPGPGQIMLRTVCVGIDGTDREIHEGIYGTPPDGLSYLVLGHEALAKVERKGRDAEGFEQGELVVPTVRRPDDCVNCRSAESDMCIKGDYKEHGINGLHGFASELCISDADFLVKVPEELSDLAVLLEPMSIGEKAIQQVQRIQQRMVWKPERAFVLGAGPLGLLTALILRLRGFSVKVAATRSRESLKARLVTEMGAEYVDVNQRPLDGFSRDFDLIMEATGNVNPAMDAMGMIGRNGVLCFLGNYRNPGHLDDVQEILYDMVLGNRLMFGSVNSNRSHFVAGLSDMKEARDSYPGLMEKLITDRVKPPDFLQAFEPDREEIKTVIDF